MKNAAGDANCDEYLRQELKEAGIEIIELGFPVRQEVPTSIIGILNGWTFKRAWYYWVARAGDGTILPFEIADRLHEQHGQEVRVSGHCCCPAPREWYSKPWYFGVPLYHVDSQEGLNALAEAIRLSTQVAAVPGPGTVAGGGGAGAGGGSRDGGGGEGMREER